jgi:hypothetical protein
LESPSCLRAFSHVLVPPLGTLAQL